MIAYLLTVSFCIGMAPAYGLLFLFLLEIFATDVNLKFSTSVTNLFFIYYLHTFTNIINTILIKLLENNRFIVIDKQKQNKEKFSLLTKIKLHLVPATNYFLSCCCYKWFDDF